MSPKFWIRTARNMISRRRPYFAHLAFTHHCNLRCHFCHIRETAVAEQDTEGMKRIIDRLDRMGIAVLSISGGGEPLLRRDFADLLNYAAGKGLYTKITSNGTMPQSKYAELLASRVDEIGISLDGVRGEQLPYAHEGARILQTIHYLNDHLPAGKLLTLNVTVSAANREQIEDIVKYCTREFPRARIWLNPVVVGEGMLRVQAEPKVNPDYLRCVDSPTLLTPEFYKQACEDYYRNDKFDWQCLAGEFFFDIKPNGDFWICQDHPAKAPLNILDPDFDRKYGEADFSHRRVCGGCTYSCYYVTQKSFEPRTWPGLAEIWWKTRTEPNEPCRATAEKHGWVAGLLHFSAARLMLLAAVATRSFLSVLLLAALYGGGVVKGEEAPGTVEPREVITRMEQCNAQREEGLSSFSSRRRYVASSGLLRRKAYVVVEANYRPGAGKDFQILERAGSESVQRRVFGPMLEAERTNSHSPGREAVEISNRNYTFTFQRYDSEARAYVFRVEPKTDNRYLLRGRIWIHAEDFAIQHIEGEPARKQSFWIRRTTFVHQYAKFGGFWLPVSNRTEVELRVFGHATMGIDYYDYNWEPRSVEACKVPAPALGPRLSQAFPEGARPAGEPDE